MTGRCWTGEDVLEPLEAEVVPDCARCGHRSYEVRRCDYCDERVCDGCRYCPAPRAACLECLEQALYDAALALEPDELDGTAVARAARRLREARIGISVRLVRLEPGLRLELVTHIRAAAVIGAYAYTWRIVEQGSGAVLQASYEDHWAEVAAEAQGRRALERLAAAGRAA